MGKVGKPVIVDEEVDLIFRKLEPYLKKGLSLHKACIEGQIPKSTAYDLYNEYDEFAERIDAAKNYFSVLVSDIIHNELKRILKKQITKPVFKDPLGEDEECSKIRPDGDNFTLIKSAWKMRSEGKTLDEAANFLNNNLSKKR